MVNIDIFFYLKNASRYCIIDTWVISEMTINISFIFFFQWIFGDLKKIFIFNI